MKSKCYLSCALLAGVVSVVVLFWALVERLMSHLDPDSRIIDYITSNTGPTKTCETNGVDGLMESRWGHSKFFVPSKTGSCLKMVWTYNYKTVRELNGILLLDMTAKDFVTNSKHALI